MLLHGVTIDTVTLRQIGRGMYNDQAATLTSPAFTIKVNPGTVSPVSKGNPERRRNFSWVLTQEFDITEPSDNQPARQKAQVVLTVISGIDVTDNALGSLIDRAALVPDSGRLTPIILGAS